MNCNKLFVRKANESGFLKLRSKVLDDKITIYPGSNTIELKKVHNFLYLGDDGKYYEVTENLMNFYKGKIKTEDGKVMHSIDRMERRYYLVVKYNFINQKVKEISGLFDYIDDLREITRDDINYEVPKSGHVEEHIIFIKGDQKSKPILNRSKIIKKEELCISDFERIYEVEFSFSDMQESINKETVSAISKYEAMYKIMSLINDKNSIRFLSVKAI